MGLIHQMTRLYRGISRGAETSPGRRQGQTQQMLARQPSGATRVRWLIIWVAFTGPSINYLDRAGLSVALPFMGEEFKLSATQEGLVGVRGVPRPRQHPKANAAEIDYREAAGARTSETEAEGARSNPVAVQGHTRIFAVLSGWTGGLPPTGRSAAVPR
jgi:hypothetical protein